MTTPFCPRSLTALGLLLLLASCSAPPTTTSQAIRIDGSSTVFPITDAIAKAYTQAQSSPVEVEVGVSGTGGGFDKFCAGQTDISNASRPISEEELAACDNAGVRFIELPIAFDALTVVVNSQNTWAEDITLTELKKLWEPTAKDQVMTWNQVRASWPNRPIVLYGPGTDSGTYDYFTEVVMGADGSARQDFTASEDDEVLAKGVGDNPNALGYFGLAYYSKHQDTLKALPVDSGNGAVMPTPETVVRSQYQPLSRPLFIYVNFTAAQNRDEVRDFVQFYLKQAPATVGEVGYVPLTEEGYHIAWVNFQEGEAGTAFDGKPQPNLTIAELLRKTKRF